MQADNIQPNWVLASEDGMQLACDPEFPTYLMAFSKREFAEYAVSVGKQKDYVIKPMTTVVLREIVRRCRAVTGVSVIFSMGAESITDGKRGREVQKANMSRRLFLAA